MWNIKLRKTTIINQWRRSHWDPWGLSLTWFSADEAQPHLISDWILLLFILRICYVKHLTHPDTYSHIYLCYSVIHLSLTFLSFLYSIIVQMTRTTFIYLIYLFFSLPSLGYFSSLDVFQVFSLFFHVFLPVCLVFS